MRIIAGQHRGRSILGPADAKTTRPITDRVKQSLFDRLAAADRLEDAVVADVFAGTGSMGLECLSRGAAHVTFVERDRDASSRLEKNLHAIGQHEQAKILRMDALGRGLIQAVDERRFTLLFVDPPYPMVQHPTQQQRVWEQIERFADVADAQAVLVLRTPRDVELPAFERWPNVDSETYNMMTVHLLRR
ncbi:MAG: RsmD family RNA methyltransferase [Phycisphaeraceae bacterium]